MTTAIAIALGALSAALLGLAAAANRDREARRVRVAAGKRR